MSNLDFVIPPQKGKGSPDFGYIAKLDSDQFINWIRARLHGNDPHFHLYSGRDEDTPLGIFTFSFDNITSPVFRDNFLLALRELLKEEDRKDWTLLKDSEKLYITNLIILIGRFFNTYQGSVSGEARKIIEANIKRLCDPEGPVAEDAIPQYYIQALYTLRRIEVNLSDIWDKVLTLRNGIYIAPAFAAISIWNPLRAAKLLPDLIFAYKNNSDWIDAVFEINRFIKSHIFIKDKTNIENAIRDAFSNRPDEKADIKVIFEKLSIDISFRDDYQETINAYLNSRKNAEIACLSPGLSDSKRIYEKASANY